MNSQKKKKREEKPHLFDEEELEEELLQTYRNLKGFVVVLRYIAIPLGVSLGIALSILKLLEYLQ